MTEIAESPVIGPLRYPGSKRALVPVIAALLRASGLRPGLFVEPYVGGASVALGMLREDLAERVALCDADPRVADFWKTVFADADWLVQALGSLEPTSLQWHRMRHVRHASRRDRALSCLFLTHTSVSASLAPDARPLTPQAMRERFDREALVEAIRSAAALGDRVDLVCCRDAMAFARAMRERAMRRSMVPFFYLDPPFAAGGLYGVEHTAHQRMALPTQLAFLSQPFLMSHDPSIADACRRRGLNVVEFEMTYAAREGVSREILVSNLPATQLEVAVRRAA